MLLQRAPDRRQTAPDSNHFMCVHAMQCCLTRQNFAWTVAVGEQQLTAAGDVSVAVIACIPTVPKCAQRPIDGSQGDVDKAERGDGMSLRGRRGPGTTASATFAMRPLSSLQVCINFYGILAYTALRPARCWHEQLYAVRALADSASQRNHPPPSCLSPCFFLFPLSVFSPPPLSWCAAAEFRSASLHC